MKDTKRPRLGVVGLVSNGEGILMGRRRHGVGKGLFVLPGGGVKRDELLYKALRREVYEETGLKVNIPNPLWPIDVSEVFSKRSHLVYLVFKADVLRGLPEDSDELYDVGFYTVKRASDTTEWTRGVFERLELLD